MSTLAAFAPRSGPNGLLAQSTAVLVASTAQSGALPALGTDQGLAVFNGTTTVLTLNLGAAAAIAGNPATATFGYTIPPGALVTMTVDPSATNFSAFSASAGTIHLFRGEGK